MSDDLSELGSDGFEEQGISVEREVECMLAVAGEDGGFLNPPAAAITHSSSWNSSSIIRPVITIP